MGEFLQNAKTNYQLAVAQSRVQDFFTIFVVRPIASYSAALCYQLGISPNHLTSLGLVLHGISLWMLVAEFYLVASTLIFITYILDCSDGQLARFINNVTQFGIYYDLTADFIKESTLYLVLTYICIDVGISPLLFSTAFFILMCSFFADWINKSIKTNKSFDKSTDIKKSYKLRFKIQYWNIGIRNLVYIIAIGSYNIIIIPYYVLLIGSLMTVQKYYRIYNRLTIS